MLAQETHLIAKVENAKVCIPDQIPESTKKNNTFLIILSYFPYNCVLTSIQQTNVQTIQDAQGLRTLVIQQQEYVNVGQMMLAQAIRLIAKVENAKVCIPDQMPNSTKKILFRVFNFLNIVLHFPYNLY